MTNEENYKEAYSRQRLAREKAEALLEMRSRELYGINRSLQTAYEKLNKQKDQLIEQEKLAAKSEFLSLMSHEIKTPLNSIISMSFILDEMELDEDATKATSILMRSSEHLLSLINSLLDYAKFEASGTKLITRSANLFKLLTDVQEICFGKLDQNQVEYSFIIDDNVPETILIDDIKLKQVLLNLISNAIKFTDTGTVILKVDLKMSENKEFLVFNVDDTGVGIKAEDIEKLFEPFTQLDNGKTRSYGGTGLGLNIALTYAKLMGGGISVTSVPGKGSEFVFDCAFTRA